MIEEKLSECDNAKAIEVVEAILKFTIEGSAPHAKLVVESVDGLLTSQVETSGTVRIIYEGTDNHATELPSSADGSLDEPEEI
jgi:hypothetical protein